MKKYQPLSAPNDIRRYFLTPEDLVSYFTIRSIWE